MYIVVKCMTRILWPEVIKIAIHLNNFWFECFAKFEISRPMCLYGNVTELLFNIGPWQNKIYWFRQRSNSGIFLTHVSESQTKQEL